MTLVSYAGQFDLKELDCGLLACPTSKGPLLAEAV
jgi:hypothetical protein